MTDDPRAARSRILVVDDDLGPRESLRMLLKSSYDIRTAASGPAALAELPRYRPDLVHEGYEVLTDKPVGTLRHAVWQIPFRNLEEVIHKIDRYSSLGAQKMTHKEVSMAGAVGHASWAFLKHYFFKRGFIDGWAGFVIAFGNFEGTFYRYAKRYEELQRWGAPPSEPLRRE